MTRRRIIDPDVLRRLYEGEKIRAVEIASRLRVHPASISKAMIRNKIQKVPFMPKSKHDLSVGAKFGRWTIIEVFRERGNLSKSRVKCRCECGHERVHECATLTGGGSKSCGCLQRELIKASASKKPFESLYNRLKSCAKVRNIPVTMTYEDFVVLCEIPTCHYCGAELHRKTVAYGAGHSYKLDRKDNTKEYSVENCVASCSRCNYGKGRFSSYEEWVEVGKVLRDFREKNHA